MGANYEGTRGAPPACIGA
ncbi:unnamed protein product, partial [Allacma fusca]